MNFPSHAITRAVRQLAVEASKILTLILLAFFSVCLPVHMDSVHLGSMAYAEQLNYAGSDGRVLRQSEVQVLKTHVWPDGAGLPDGSGRASDGKTLFDSRCAGCHGAGGEGSTALELVGDHASLSSEFPDRGIAAVWAYAPTLFEYIRRAMPPEEPYSLTVDETYAVVAYILELNELLAPATELDAEGLAAIELPNRNGFIDHFPTP